MNTYDQYQQQYREIVVKRQAPHDNIELTLKEDVIFESLTRQLERR